MCEDDSAFRESECFVVCSAPQEACEEDAEDVLGLELAQNCQCVDDESVSLRGFLRLYFFFLHASTSALYASFTFA